MTTFEVVAEPTRRRILDVLREGERSVGELVERIELSQPGVSKHLRVQRRVYSVRTEPLEEIDAWLEPYRRLWARTLDDLERHLDSQSKEKSR
jgi:DNA-binding transcriptional ArsR family regulator